MRERFLARELLRDDANLLDTYIRVGIYNVPDFHLASAALSVDSW